jgi:hypothetical protein
MGGYGVHEIFSAYVKRLLLIIILWGRSFPYRPSFFILVVQIPSTNFLTNLSTNF